MKIVALGGSMRPQSLSYRVLELALKKVEEHSVPTELIDLRKLNLPFCSGESFYPHHPDVQVLRQSIQSATGLLLSTPEYHGNVSGVLKNALDLLEEEQMAGKVVGLIAVVGGVHSTNALNTLRLICRQLRCWVLPEQLVIPYSEDNFDRHGELKESFFEQRLEKLVEHLVVATRKLGASPNA
jgi:NAD(P)H-dependent FMN reductase